jgi:selenocysteine lyase/cysteine desulfurase
MTNPTEDTSELLRREFPVTQNLVYLNHAAVAPWPKRTGDAVREFADQCVSGGSRNYPAWLETEARLRERCRRLLNAPSADDIALLKNTSEGLSVVAHGFPWKPGDNIVISDEEFPSNRIVWESLADAGVAVREVSLKTDDPEAALIAACDARTRLLSISTVQYASGLRVDLARLGAACSDRGVAFCVDAIQGLGVVAHDVDRMHIDFLVADGHKWLLGPEGLAVFYVAPAWRERLKLHQYGWHMVAAHHDFDARDWRPAPSARRFECGSPNMIGIHALDASLSLLDEIGFDEVERRVLANSEYLMSEVQRHADLELVTRRDPGRYAGIVVFRSTRRPPDQLYRDLMERGVMCAHRGGGVRFSPHCYNTAHELDEAMAHVARSIGAH